MVGHVYTYSNCHGCKFFEKGIPAQEQMEGLKCNKHIYAGSKYWQSTEV